MLRTCVMYFCNASISAFGDEATTGESKPTTEALSEARFSLLLALRGFPLRLSLGKGLMGGGILR